MLQCHANLGKIVRPITIDRINMADTQNENDSAVQIRSRGEAREITEPTNDQTGQVQHNTNQAQQQQQEGSPWKSMIFRMVIFWLVINFFRSRTQSPTKTDDGKGVETGPCSNVFRDGQLMVCMYSCLYRSNLF